MITEKAYKELIQAFTVLHELDSSFFYSVDQKGIYNEDGELEIETVRLGGDRCGVIWGSKSYIQKGVEMMKEHWLALGQQQYKELVREMLF